jgi:hypothetical protein
MWIQWVWMNWKLGLLILATACAGIQTLRLQAATAQRDLAVQNLANYKQAAETAATTAKAISDKAIKETNDAIPKLVEAAKSNAYKNYLAKYGMGNAACGISTRLPTGDPVHNGEAGSTSQPDAASGEQLFAEACARDAGRLDLWVKWATDNELKVID